MTQVVIEEKITMANHIKGTFPKNVGKAHPTKTPLNPQSPAVPFSAGYLRRYPVIVEINKAAKAYQATAGLLVI